MTDSTSRIAPSPDHVEAMVETLRSFAKAYSQEFFPPITDDERKQLGPNIITRASAMMGRHFGRFASDAADMLESLSAATPVQPATHGSMNEAKMCAWGPNEHDFAKPATREFSNRERDAMRNALARVLAGETDDFDVDAGQSALGKLRGVSAK